MPTTKIMATPLKKSKYSFLCFIVSNIIAVQKYCKTIVLANTAICNIIQALTATEKKKRQTKMLVCRLVSPLLINYLTSL